MVELGDNAMNHYIYKLGTQVGEIRKLLNWSQGDLARKMGVSRPTVLNIEKDPTKMSKTVALALVTVVIYEIGERMRHIERTNYAQWDNASRRETFLRDLKTYGGLSAAIIGLIFSVPPKGLKLPALGMLTSLIAKPEMSLKQNELKSEDIKEIALESINALQTKLSEHFFVGTLNLAECVRMIEGDDEIIDAIVVDDE